MTNRFAPPKGKRPVFIGAGDAPCVRHTERSLASMLAEAMTNAIADAGLLTRADRRLLHGPESAGRVSPKAGWPGHRAAATLHEADRLAERPLVRQQWHPRHRRERDRGGQRARRGRLRLRHRGKRRAPAERALSQDRADPRQRRGRVHAAVRRWQRPAPVLQPVSWRSTEPTARRWRTSS